MARFFTRVCIDRICFYLCGWKSTRVRRCDTDVRKDRNVLGDVLPQYFQESRIGRRDLDHLLVLLGRRERRDEDGDGENDGYHDQRKRLHDCLLYVRVSYSHRTVYVQYTIFNLQMQVSVRYI